MVAGYFVMEICGGNVIGLSLSMAPFSMALVFVTLVQRCSLIRVNEPALASVAFCYRTNCVLSQDSPVRKDLLLLI